MSRLGDAIVYQARRKAQQERNVMQGVVVGVDPLRVDLFGRNLPPLREGDDFELTYWMRIYKREVGFKTGDTALLHQLDHFWSFFDVHSTATAPRIADLAGIKTISAATGPPGPQGPAGAQGAVGPAGPQGATGATGPQGAQGVAGAQGPAGQSFTARGLWSNTTAYNIDDAVQGSDGSMYIASAANTGQDPVADTGGGARNGTYWMPSVIHGATGPQGPTGAQGATGATGPAGPQGIQGATGATGPAGPQGATGPAGPPPPYTTLANQPAGTDRVLWVRTDDGGGNGLWQYESGAYVRIAPPVLHASQHATGGSDPVSPAAIGAEATANKGAANGYAALDANQHLVQLPVKPVFWATSVTSTMNIVTGTFTDYNAWGNGAGTTHDPNSMLQADKTSVKVPVAGYYRVTVIMPWQAGADGGQTRLTFVQKTSGGTTTSVAAVAQPPPPSGSSLVLVQALVSPPVLCAANDTLKVTLFHDQGSTIAPPIQNAGPAFGVEFLSA